MGFLGDLWVTDVRSDRNNMEPMAALKFWASAGIRMPWIEPLTWAYVALAVFVYAFLWVPPEKAAVLSADWVAFVIARNLIIYFIFYGGAHHFLYESPAAQQLAAQDLKFNPKMPGSQGKKDEIPGGWAPLSTTLRLLLTRRGAELSRIAQHSHDRFWCLTSSVVSSLMEVYFIHAWASGALPVLADHEVFTAASISHLFFSPFWRTVHFYSVHRLIHSRFLYKNVHYLHHRSRNPAPWSGLSMHPIESFGYFTCVLTPLVFTAHPVHFLFIKLHADISPIPGHHGYASGDASGQGKAYLKGQQFHWLHHHCNCLALLQPLRLPPAARFSLHSLAGAAVADFECNYGSDLVPCDHIFGTYRKDSPEIARVASPSDEAKAAREAAAAKAKTA